LSPVQAAISGIMTILVYTVILFAVFKIFQIATDLGEIKEVLKDIKRGIEDHSPASLSTVRSPESLLRAVTAESYPPLESTLVGRVPDLPNLKPPA
jgi:hypothetical protein